MPIPEPAQALADITGTRADYRAPDATTDSLTAGSAEDVRDLVLRRTVWEARRLGQPVELTTTGDRGEHRILVTPDGSVSPVMGDTATSLPVVEPVRPEAGFAAGGAGTGSGRGRPSFVEPEAQPTPVGILGALRRVGAPVKQTQAQLRHAGNVRDTSQQWPGSRSIAVVNGKGGVGKTMTTALLAAVFARNGGGGVLAWDNNDTRGTLGWRTESGPHSATVIDAVAASKKLLSPTAPSATIAGYVHHQTEDRYDVLRSNPHLLATRQRIGGDEFDKLMQIAARYYRLVIFDSGNDESADRWLRMIDATQQLVVPTLPAPESAESAALLLEALAERDEHSAALAHNAVVVVTEPERGGQSNTRVVADAFQGLVREAVVIPFDPAMKSGALRFDALRPATRRAWTAAAAAIAAGIDRE
jgi:MinD-like ATPase involved in chromosome partitioning or flagellar assembly